MDRKEFFQQAFQEAARAAVNSRLGGFFESLAEPKERPPGAVPEGLFQSLCTGCDACMIACPVNVVMIEDPENRLPVIYPEKDPCILCEERPCIAACPTGALRHS